MRVYLVLLFTLVLGCSHAPHTTAKKHETGAEETKQELFAQSLRDQAILSYQKNDYLKSNQLFEAASLIDGNGLEARFLTLQYYSQLSLGFYDKALKTAQKITKNFAFLGTSYQQVGLAQLWKGETEEAAKSFRRGLEFDSHSPKLHFYFGLSQEMLGKIEDRDKAFKKAEDEYLQILSKNPKDFITNYDIASLYLYWNKNIVEAEEYLKTAKKMGPESEGDVTAEGNVFAQFYFPVMEGILQFRKGNTQDAEALFLTGLKNAQPGLRAELAEVNYYLGLVKEAQSDKTSSKMFLDQSLLFDSHGPFAHPSELELTKLTARADLK